MIKNLPAKDVFIYVDNYFEGHAPATANKLNALLGLGRPILNCSKTSLRCFDRQRSTLRKSKPFPLLFVVITVV